MGRDKGRGGGVKFIRGRKTRGNKFARGRNVTLWDYGVVDESFILSFTNFVSRRRDSPFMKKKKLTQLESYALPPRDLSSVALGATVTEDNYS